MAETALHPHEAAFVQGFLIRERRERAIDLLSHPEKRREFTERLNHRFMRDLDRCWVRADPDERLAALRSDALAYIIADEDHFDRQTVTTEEIPTVIRGALFGIVVSVIPGKLAVYKDEAPAKPVWLSRP